MAGDIGKKLPRGKVVGRPKEGISRRQLLKLGVKAGVLALAGKQAYDIEQAADREVREGVGAVQDFFRGEEENQKGVTVEVNQRPDLVSSEFRTVFPNLTENEKAQALQEVRISKSAILVNLDNEAIERISSNERLILGSAAGVNMPENVARLLIGLVIAESNGRPKAVSSKGAKGLTQMDDNMTRRYGLVLSDGDDDERFDPEKILPATAQELTAQYERYGDWGLAFWSWHLGDPQLYEALQIYVKDEYGKELPSTYVEPTDESSEAQAVATFEAQRRISLYKEMIQKKGITVYHILSNPTIAEMFSGEEWNMTDEYVFRVVAASEAYREEKGKLGF